MGSTRPHLRWASGLVVQEIGRERPASVQVQQLPFGSPPGTESMPTLHEQCNVGSPWKSSQNNPISSDGGGYMSDSPPAAYLSQRNQQRRYQTHSGSFLDRSEYETDQPLAVRGSTRAFRAIVWVFFRP